MLLQYANIRSLYITYLFVLNFLPLPEESESHGNLTLNERFTKLQSPTSSSQEQKERR